MIQYAQPDLLTQLCSAQRENLGILLVEVVANVLDVEVSANNEIFLKKTLKFSPKKEIRHNIFGFFNLDL